MKKTVVIAMIMIFTLTGIAAARGPGGDRGPGDGLKGERGKYWENERIAQELSLTDDEIAKLEQLHDELRNTIQSLREEQKEGHEALKEIMDSDNFSPSDARMQFKKIEDVRYKISEERFEMRLEQRQMLGSERFSRLQEMGRRSMERRHRDR